MNIKRKAPISSAKSSVSKENFDKGNTSKTLSTYVKCRDGAVSGAGKTKGSY